MNQEELDLSNINAIDMECEAPDEDDDSFGNIKVDFKAQPENISDQRDVKKVTGVILNFSDDDTEEVNLKPIVVSDLEDLKQQKADHASKTGDFSGINEIDMECSIGEDDDDSDVLGYSVPEKVKNKSLDFGDFDEEDALLKGELVDDEILEESKKKSSDPINQGQVENDYYEKLKKKHAATNVKGAYNTHFHIAGNPKLEMDDFNHMMTPNGSVPNIATAQSGAGDSNMTVAAQGMGMAESVNNNYRALFEDLLKITGFELEPKEDNTFILKDLYDKENCATCQTLDDVTNFLDPYVNDCFIIPLQIETGKDFNTCGEWKTWYDENAENYPQCGRDVAYCDVYANHLPECKLF